VASLRACIAHRVPSKGAALAFYTIFSMAPILILAIAIAGHVLGTHAARGEVFRNLQGLLSPTMAEAVQSLVLDAQIPGSGRTATWVALLLLAVGATSVFAELKDSLDEIWQQQAPIPKGILTILRTRLLGVLLILGLVCMLLLSLAVNAGLTLANLLWNGDLAYPALLAPMVTFGMVVCLFATINKVLPEARLSWGDAFVGALFTGVLFELGRHLIGIYLKVSTLGSTFGAAGSLAALLIWVYYSAQIFFLGAEFTREYALAFGSRREKP
jgi:membrane protein